MTETLRHGHRGAAVVILLGGGLGVALATWISGDRGWATAALAIYAVLAIGAYLWAGRATDIGAILRASGDERQRGLDRDATAITGLVMSTVAVLGAIIEIGRTGNPGVWGTMCVVGGVTYTVSLAALRRSR